MLTVGEADRTLLLSDAVRNTTLERLQFSSGRIADATVASTCLYVLVEEDAGDTVLYHVADDAERTVCEVYRMAGITAEVVVHVVWTRDRSSVVVGTGEGMFETSFVDHELRNTRFN